jgi:polysaccharide biosynthesis/export protein
MKLFSNRSRRGPTARRRGVAVSIPGLKTIWLATAMMLIGDSSLLASEPSNPTPASEPSTTIEMQSKAAAALAAAMGTSGTDSMVQNDSAQTLPPAIAPAVPTNMAAEPSSPTPAENGSVKTPPSAVAQMPAAVNTTSKPSNLAPAPVTLTTMQMQSEVAAPPAATMSTSGTGPVTQNNSVKMSPQAIVPTLSTPMAAESSSPAPAPVAQTAAEKQAKATAALAAAMGAPGTDLVAQNDSVKTPTQAVTHAAPANVDYISTNAMELLDNNYKLAIGDSITFQILEDEDDPKTLSVQDSGDVEFPYIGRFPATGKTCRQLAKQVKTELEKKYYYRATVIISVNAMITHGIVYIVGGVKAPGPLEIPRDDVLTISKAILRAGGFDDFADEKHVRVTRRGDDGTNEVLTVNVGAVLNNGQTDKDVKAEPGDLIYVPEKTVHF